MEEEEIIGLFATRSERAIEKLSKKYSNYCRKISMSILNNKEDSDECLNDCWLAAWNTIPPQPSETNLLGAYVYRLIRNISIMKKRHNAALKRNSMSDMVLDEFLEVIPTKETPETLLFAKELTELLNQFLDNLDTESATLFTLRYWFLESSEQIGQKLNLKPNTVNVKLKRIRGKLKTFLEEKEVLG